MRLHSALEHINNGHFRSMEPWPANEPAYLARYIRQHADETIEFSFEFLDVDGSGDTLETFISFANELWDSGLAPIPHNFFWVSWHQKVHMAAFCERIHSENDNSVIALSVRVMFENALRNSLAFVNQAGHLVLGDHKHVLISHADSDSAGMLVENGLGTVKALLGALATPQAIRHEEPAPEKLNRQRIRKGKVPISSRIVIDVRATKQAAAARKSEGGWTVKPHWRSGHVRRLADGRHIPIPPTKVNMDSAVGMKPEYVVKV